MLIVQAHGNYEELLPEAARTLDSKLRQNHYATVPTKRAVQYWEHGQSGHPGHETSQTEARGDHW
jgi:hypothetical protein